MGFGAWVMGGTDITWVAIWGRQFLFGGTQLYLLCMLDKETTHLLSRLETYLQGGTWGRKTVWGGIRLFPSWSRWQQQNQLLYQDDVFEQRAILLVLGDVILGRVSLRIQRALLWNKQERTVKYMNNRRISCHDFIFTLRALAVLNVHPIVAWNF